MFTYFNPAVKYKVVYYSGADKLKVVWKAIALKFRKALDVISYQNSFLPF